MKKKLLMLLIGSMLLGMVGCTNKGDDSNKSTDSTKGTKQEATTEPTVEPTEAPKEKKEVTVETLLENIRDCEYNEVTFFIDSKGKTVDEYGDVDIEIILEVKNVFDGDIAYEEYEYTYIYDMVAFKEMIKKSYEAAGMPEDEWEEYYELSLEAAGIVDGRLSRKDKAYRLLEDDTWYLLEYFDNSDVWYKMEAQENDKGEKALDFVLECCREAELTEAEDGYILSANVVNNDLMEEIGFYAVDKELEVKAFFDTNAIFEKFEINIYDVDDEGMLFDTVLVTFEFSNDFDGELTLPSNIKNYGM